MEANSDFIYLKFYFFGIFVYKNGQQTSPLNQFSVWPSSVAGFLSTKSIQSTKSVRLKSVHHCICELNELDFSLILPPYYTFQVIVDVPELETLAGKLLVFDATTSRFRCVKLRSRRPDVTPVSLIDYEEFCGSAATDKARLFVLHFSKGGYLTLLRNG